MTRGLTRSQQTLIEKARSAGTSPMAPRLEDEDLAWLGAITVRDLDRRDLFPRIPWSKVSAYFEEGPLERRRLPSIDLEPMLATLFREIPDADAYLSCLAKLHKSRLKYERVLSEQPFPNLEQVGPRGLLQYGLLSPKALTAFLCWRKWLFDLDNRAAQETGYLFEPILAHAIGGAPFSAGRSPIRRRRDPSKGRQIDCIRKKKAYELKMRVTRAASGQGRWREEIELPEDCRASGYTPILVVFDSTRSSKLHELGAAFEAAGGEVYLGSEAWEHLQTEAGETMSVFLRTYVREPLDQLLEHAREPLGELRLQWEPECVILTIGDEEHRIPRVDSTTAGSESAALPEDVDEELPGL